MTLAIGDSIELTKSVRGVPVGTKGVVKEFEHGEIIMDLQVNDVVLPVSVDDVKQV